LASAIPRRSEDIGCLRDRPAGGLKERDPLDAGLTSKPDRQFAQMVGFHSGRRLLPAQRTQREMHPAPLLFAPLEPIH
jgi:hypothetical protein